MHTVLMAMVLSSGWVIEETGIVRATVEGLTGSEGSLMVLLFSQAAGLPPDVEKVLAFDRCEVSDSTLTVVFLGVPHGEYAILAFQDLDCDNEPDIGDSGFTEPFSYSMQAGMEIGVTLFGSEAPSGDRPSGPPSGGDGIHPRAVEITFEMISFEHSGNETSVRMTMTGAGAMGHPAGVVDIPPAGPGGPPPVGRNPGFITNSV